MAGVATRPGESLLSMGSGQKRDFGPISVEYQGSAHNRGGWGVYDGAGKYVRAYSHRNGDEKPGAAAKVALHLHHALSQAQFGNIQ